MWGPDFPLSDSQKNLISFWEVKTISLLYGVSILIKPADRVDDTKFGGTGWSIFLAWCFRIDLSEELSSVAPGTVMRDPELHTSTLWALFLHLQNKDISGHFRGLVERIKWVIAGWASYQHKQLELSFHHFNLAFQYWPHTLFEETQSPPCFLSQSSWKSHLLFSSRNKESCMSHSHTVTWEAFISTVQWAFTLCIYYGMFCVRRILMRPWQQPLQGGFEQGHFLLDKKLRH